MSWKPVHPENPGRREWLGFWSMIVLQAQNAFNDKAAQFLLIPLSGAVGAGFLRLRIEDAAALLIALPFVLFAPLAGWFSDRFSKRDVMIGTSVAQLVILVWILLSILFRSIPLGMVGFFALAVQSAFFGPAKIGINKELVGSRHLGFAAGVQQMMAMVAMLVGQIIMGFLFDARWRAGGQSVDAAWAAAAGPMIVLAVAGIPAIIFSVLIPRTPAQGAPALRASTTVQHFKDLRTLWSDRPLRQASLGVAFFWGFAAFLNLWTIKVAAELTRSGEGWGTLQSWFMIAAGVGMIAGFGCAALLLKRRIELGWVPIAGLLMTLGCVVLSLLDPRHSLSLLEHGPRAAASSLFLWAIVLLAFVAALFLAPLIAWMQDRYPEEKRGELQSASNLQDCLAGIMGAVVIMFGMGLLPVASGFAKLQVILLVCAALCLGITIRALQLLPREFVRTIGLALVRLCYRIRPVGAGNLPAQGGVLMLSNHVSWADAFFLTAACPREPRFVMDGAYMASRPVRWFCNLFHTITIDPDKPLEGMRHAKQALAEGHAVIWFPEGQLTRTGTLQELHRGCEVLARMARVPVVPVWMDGVWGSLFSFERGRFFFKWPHGVLRRITVVFGAPLQGEKASLPLIKAGMREAAAQALRQQSWHENRETRANAWQLAQVNWLPPKTRCARLPHDPEIDALPALAKHLSLHPVKPEETKDPGPWVGGDLLRAEILKGNIPPGAFYDFGSQACQPLESSGWKHYPCLAVDGVVVSMSLPDPPTPGELARPQIGSKKGALGRLLPGFTVSGDATQINGPTTAEKTVKIPGGLVIEPDDWVRCAPTRP